MENEDNSPPANEKIVNQLEHMLTSPNFHTTPEQTALLRYIVDRTLAGKASEITDETVAAEIFGRGSNDDRSIDPVVSIQTALLRRSLVRYYETAGKDDPVQIDIPPGTCVPIFKPLRP
jgi:hypothetical protein